MCVFASCSERNTEKSLKNIFLKNSIFEKYNICLLNTYNHYKEYHVRNKKNQLDKITVIRMTWSHFI